MTKPVIEHRILKRKLADDGLEAGELLGTLKELREGNIQYPYIGICGNAECHYTSGYMSQFWPGFSGDREYPVPHPTLCPEAAFDSIATLEKLPRDMWGNQYELDPANPDDVYRRNRWNYLDWMIEQLEEHLQWLSVSTN